MADGQAEKVDHLVGVRPDEMRAEDEVRPLVDQNFVAIDRLGEPAGGVPVRRPGRVNPALEAAAARRLFRKPDGGDRWQDGKSTRMHSSHSCELSMPSLG